MLKVAVIAVVNLHPRTRQWLPERVTEFPLDELWLMDIIKLICQTILKVASKVHLVHPRVPPVFGAVMLGMEANGLK